MYIYIYIEREREIHTWICYLPNAVSFFKSGEYFGRLW